jgi:hypothetical protein
MFLSYAVDSEACCVANDAQEIIIRMLLVNNIREKGFNMIISCIESMNNQRVIAVAW